MYRSAPEARLNARAGTSFVIAVGSAAVFSFSRSWRKLVETGRRDALESLRGVAVSFLITAAPGGESLAQNPVPKGRPAEGARDREFAARAITGGVNTLPRCIVILGRRPRVS